jgi:DNA-binding PadR family transcriptional regulator
MEVPMDEKIKRIYIPMTETGFYILFCLQEEMHGYTIGQKVKAMTGGEIIISPGTMYGSLSKMEKDGLINFVKEEDKRKTYIISKLGQEVLDIELRRIERLYKNSKGVVINGEKD